MMSKLQIDEGFRKMILPLSADERKLLEENIAKDGCREPICVWNNVILDGHNRYEICTRLQRPFTVAHIFLRNREEAITWICTNQLGRRNISDETRRYLIGKRYEIEKNLRVRNPTGKNQYIKNEVWTQNVAEPQFDDSAGQTRKRLGKEYNVSDNTVTRYWGFTRAIDKLSKVEPELTPKILSGKIKLTHEDVVGLSQLSLADIKSASTNLLNDPSGVNRHKITRQIIPLKRKNAKSSLLSVKTGSVKDSPVYDPDSKVKSLIYTVPSWISTIERIAVESDYNEISEKTYVKLTGVLNTLVDSTKAMLDMIKEATHEQ